VVSVAHPMLSVTLRQETRSLVGAIPVHVASRIAVNSIGMRLASIPAGEFMMGSDDPSEALDDHYADERPAHRVQINRVFYLGIHEVTVGQFRQFVSDSNYRTDAERGVAFPGGFGLDSASGELGAAETYSWRNVGFDLSDDHPVVNVSWNDAVAFCEWLSRKEGRSCRLPTEAEWEYACRAGTDTRYHHGDAAGRIVEVANVADATARKSFPDWTWTLQASDGYALAAPVGRFRPNAFGLYDMHGNVYEWCSDWYDEEYYSQSPTESPPGPDFGFTRVYRGGSWASESDNCRSAYRQHDEPAGRSLVLGFRVVMDVSE
jgi:formylglycine-generating enzyme